MICFQRIITGDFMSDVLEARLENWSVVACEFLQNIVDAGDLGAIELDAARWLLEDHKNITVGEA